MYEIKYNGISKNHYYSIFWILEFKKNNAGSFLHDENNNNKFEEDEKDRFSYSVRDNFVYMKFEGQEEKKVKFEIILKNNSSYPADKGFTFHTKALIEKRIDEYSNETIYEFWEYEPK